LFLNSEPCYTDYIVSDMLNRTVDDYPIFD